MKGVQYRDTFAASGSALYAAITEGKDPKKIEEIYREAKSKFYWPDDKKHLLNWRIGDQS